MSNEKIVGEKPFGFLGAWDTSVASGNVGAIPSHVDVYSLAPSLGTLYPVLIMEG